ncbi:GNAT family N-acetyltransferase [Paenibacillus sp. y28]|uniref:GNAT family N-acetyltransferase n=1 Tax=Paenibacillus sp. y28 TaxID=3129110 RepID=UPI003017EA56
MKQGPFEYPALETPRLRLRKLTTADAQAMFQYCSDPAVTRFTTWYPHPSQDVTEAFIRAAIRMYEEGQAAPWGIEDKAAGSLIGTCGFVNWSTQHAKAELGYALSQAYWRQGYMTEAVRALMSYGFEIMQLVRIEARCHVDNRASANVLEKNGMQLEGIMRKHLFAKGRFEDVCMYAMIHEENGRRRETASRAAGEFFSGI